MQKSKNNLTALTPQALKLPVMFSEYQLKKCPKCKKGLRYEYTFRKNGSRRSISSTKGLDDLKQKVLSQNLIMVGI